MKKVLIALALIGGVVIMQGTAAADNHQITICHATGNPGHYSMPSPSKQQISKDGGHQNGNENSVHSGDIIPPFEAGSHGGQEWDAFAGQNWDEEGQAIFANDCTVPEEETTTTESTTTTTIEETTTTISNMDAQADVPAVRATVDRERLPHTGSNLLLAGIGVAAIGLGVLARRKAARL